MFIMSPDGRRLLPSRLANLVTSTMIEAVPHRQYLAKFPDTLEHQIRDALIAKEIETSFEPQTQFSPLRTQYEESDTEGNFFTPSPQKQLGDSSDKNNDTDISKDSVDRDTGKCNIV
jgi:hypothetical protein